MKINYFTESKNYKKNITKFDVNPLNNIKSENIINKEVKSFSKKINNTVNYDLLSNKVFKDNFNPFKETLNTKHYFTYKRFFNKNYK